MDAGGGAVSTERNYKRSKDGIHWTKITFQRLKQDAWKADSVFGGALVAYVLDGAEMDFENGYTYAISPTPCKKVAGK